MSKQQEEAVVGSAANVADWIGSATSSMGTISPSEVSIKEEVQRRYRPDRAAKIASKFDPEKVGVVTVNIRDTGEIVQIDGMHRFGGANLAGFGDYRFNAHIYRGLTPQQEADLFLALNDTVQVPATDKFRVGLTSGDPAAIGVQKILDKFGFEISYPAARYNFSAVQRAMTIWRQSPAALNAAFQVLTDAWTDNAANPGMVSAELVHGVALVAMESGDRLDRGRLATVLRNYGGGPQAFIGYARSRRTTKGGSASAMVALVMRELYNKGLKKSQLLIGDSPQRREQDVTEQPVVDTNAADLLPPPADGE